MPDGKETTELISCSQSASSNQPFSESFGHHYFPGWLSFIVLALGDRRFQAWLPPFQLSMQLLGPLFHARCWPLAGGKTSRHGSSARFGSRYEGYSLLTAFLGPGLSKQSETPKNR